MNRSQAAVVLSLLFLAQARPAEAHPLGNFSVNRWAALRAGERSLRVDYIVDFAEIPTFQEAPAIDADGDGRESEAEVSAFAASRARELGAGLDLAIAGRPAALRLVSSRLVFAPGAGGLRTMRLEARYEPAEDSGIPEEGAAVSFHDTNFAARAGWREVIAFGEGQTAVVDSSVPAADLSRALTSYPADLVLAPPQASRAEFRLVRGEAAARALASGAASVNPALAESVPDGPASPSLRAPADPLTGLIGPASSRFAFGVLVAAFAAALFWGGAHALSPGHGKTIVAAYLVGQRGAAIHAVWLGLIVTVTHTAGVFALGALTLLMSRWFVPEALYPWLAFVSGLTVLVMGAVLLRLRLRGLTRPAAAPDGTHAADHGPHGPDHGPHDHDRHGHSHAAGVPEHHHAGADGAEHPHSHLPPERLSLKGLVALGVAGGIVPCPAALVVLLSAVAFNRVLFGLALILAFSAGLAGVLVAVGLLMVYARRAFDRFDTRGTLAGRLGVASAAAVLLMGLAITLRSLPPGLVEAAAAASLSPIGAALGVLGLGLLFGLKHATEADHVAAVSTIVSEGGGLRRALWTGGLWGAGHTFSILVAGLFVLGLHLVIPETMARWLELGVALMIIGLGGTALARALRNRPDAHRHLHLHGSRSHAHLHFHAEQDGHAPALEALPHPVHTVGRIGLKPLLVGMMHGLAGSAALTLLVLAQIRSVTLGMLYLLVFGAGSIGGMAVMSLVIGLPFAAAASRPGLHRGLRTATGALSLVFGVFYAWTQIASLDSPFSLW